MVPIMFVSRLAFGSEAAHGELQLAWRKQVVKVGRNKKPWMAVSGPTGTTLFNLARLEWQIVSAFV